MTASSNGEITNFPPALALTRLISDRMLTVGLRVLQKARVPHDEKMTVFCAAMALAIRTVNKKTMAGFEAHVIDILTKDPEIAH